jgi:hypothetical protein
MMMGASLYCADRERYRTKWKKEKKRIFFSK